jgi:addiction module HigA family antidote
MRERTPIHPGEVLEEDFLKPMNLTKYRLAKDIGVPATRIQEIVDGKRGITADTALRLSRYFGTSAELWMGLQNDYEIELVKMQLEHELEGIKPLSSRPSRP